MQLVYILLVVVSALGLLSGFFTLIGSEKSSKPFAIFFVLFSLAYVLWASSIINESIMMTNLNISVVFFASTLLITVWSFASAHTNKSTRAHKGWRILSLSCLILADAAALIYYILVLNGSAISWIAPLVMAPIFVIFFYTILRYRILQISNRVCKIWAYAVLSILCVIAYMCLFMLIAQSLFHVVVPVEITALNLLMIIIVTALFPVWSEFNSALNSLLSTSNVNLNFIVKSLNRFATQNVKLDRLAEFLADHLHFRYIGLIVEDKVYGTKKINFTESDLAAIRTTETEEKKNWLKPAEHTKVLFEKENIVAAAELRDAKGRPFGYILIGQPMGKTTFEKRDLHSIEMIINLVASIIDSEERLKK